MCLAKLYVQSTKLVRRIAEQIHGKDTQSVETKITGKTQVRELC